MKSIGIKQADGTFYKILDEGTAGTKQLVLTTVKDNQTTVQIDLYRSETDSMSDAEYVDTLRIKNLEPHPNGEPNLQLYVSIDDNGELHATVDDPETGKSSQIQVSLVSLSPEERNNDFTAADFAAGTAVAAGTAAAVEAIMAEPDDTLNPDIISADNEAEVNNMIGPSPNEEEFSFDDIESVTPVPEEIIPAAEEVPAEPEIDLADFDTIPLPGEPEEVPVTEDTSFDIDAPAAEDTPVFDTDIPTTEDSADFDIDNVVPEDTSFDIDAPAVEDTADFDADIPSPEDTTDFGIDIPSPEDTSFDIDAPAVEDTPVFDESIPDSDTDAAFTDDIAEENVIEENSSEIFDPSESVEDEIPQEDIAEDNSSIFDLPDFSIDDSPVTDEAVSESFDDTPAVSNDNPFDDTDDIFADTPAPQSDGLDFDDLYDKETLNGTSSYDYEEDTKRKTKVPVLICIVCAAICIIAAVLFLFVIPCKFNLRNLKANDEVTVEEPAIVLEPEEVVETPAPVEAKENEIVVAVVPETVVPEQPAPPKEKPADIRYKIKWGDTLWDIADAYYKNPWRYKMLARYNGIKNPNLIISGKYLYIPAE